MAIARKKTTRRATAAKKPARKPVKKVAIGAKSRATKKAPSKRLKARRAANTKKGFYPNPVKKRAVAAKYVVFIVKNGVRYYLHKIGTRYGWDSEKPTGYALSTAQKMGMQEGAKALAKLPKTCAVYIEKK